jgi:hypothetical protein
MAIPIDELIEQVKQANRIETIVARYFTVKGHGRRITTHEHASLQVDIDLQSYWWWSKGTHGDVINWVMEQEGIDFKAAIEQLCRWGNLPQPDWSKADPQARMATRQREDVFTVASDVFHKWLLASEKAMAYCHDRGWTDETIERTRIGYTGEPTDKKLRIEMVDAFGAAGIDINCPAAVAILGFRGNVKQWGTDYGVDVDPEWIEKGYIYSIIGWDRIVYSHMFGGRCEYMQLRGMQDKSHFNLHSRLVGERKVFTNTKWAKSSPLCVIVEGQADAITLDQWEIPAIALCGVAADERVARLIGATKEDRHAIFYLGLDTDKAGSFDSFVSEQDKGQNKKPSNTFKIAQLIGPTTYLLRWDKIASSTIKGYKDSDQIKDANDILKLAVKKKLDLRKVGVDVGHEINACDTTFIVKLAELAGKEPGARRQEAIDQVVQAAADLEETVYPRFAKDIVKALDIPGFDQRTLKSSISALVKDEKKREIGGEDSIYTLGGYINGHLLDYLYDPEDQKPLLVCRFPDGKIELNYSFVIEGKRYAALPPTETIKRGGITFPSKLPPRVKNTRELALLIEGFVNRNYMLGNPLFAKIISYYVLLTWQYDSFKTIPYLRATGEPGAGKSELMRRIGLLCYRTLSTSGASSTSSLFHMIDRYKGSLYMDEMDLSDSSAAADIMKLITAGNQAGVPIFRSTKVTIDGKESWEEEMYQIFCPKLIAMQGSFIDRAAESRCITFQVQPREVSELKDANVPLFINKEMLDEALAIQNQLLRWRMENWQPNREINPDYYNLKISARLNQITMAIQMIAEDDAKLREEINFFMNAYYQWLIQDKAMTVEARIIEAMWLIYQFPDLKQTMVTTGGNGLEMIKVGHIKNVANQIMKYMNMDEEDNDEGTETTSKKKKKDAISAQMVGHRLRDKLQMEMAPRTSEGFFVLWDEKHLQALSNRYGINPEELSPNDEGACKILAKIKESPKETPATKPGPKPKGQTEKLPGMEGGSK